MRVILPVGAGSGVDTIMRAAQPALTKALGGQPVVIENLPGAGGITGTHGDRQGRARRQHDRRGLEQPRGQPERVQEDARTTASNDITPISGDRRTPFVLVVNPAKVPAKNAKELQALLKAKPGVYNYASSGNGTIIHLAGEMFVDAAGVDAQAHPVQGRRARWWPT